jgi:hypothetical protein
MGMTAGHAAPSDWLRDHQQAISTPRNANRSPSERQGIGFPLERTTCHPLPSHGARMNEFDYQRTVIAYHGCDAATLNEILSRRGKLQSSENAPLSPVQGLLGRFAI